MKHKHVNKKTVSAFLLCLSILLFVLTLKTSFNISNFNTSQVKNHIEYLASDELKGRLTGTLENQMAEKYIRDNFKEKGLLPFQDSYINSFKVKYPKKLNFDPSFRIINENNEPLETLVYGKDYKEDLANFKINTIKFDKSNILKKNENYLIIQKDNNKVLLYVPDNDDFSFRSSFFVDAPFDLYISMTKDALNKTISTLEENNFIDISIPYEIKETTVNNALGYIKGRNSNESPIIISCHFDHLGEDLLGNVYNGALDNASGTSLVLELIDYVKKLGTPDRDILFVAFNAEEFGCLGSNNFINEYKEIFKNSKIYNFDMIGSFNGVPLCIMGGKEDTKETALIHDLSKIFEEKNIYFNYLFENSSDHEGFRKHQIEAVTLSDYDLSKIHTPEDTIEFIDEKAIDRAFDVISKELIENYYTKAPLVKHNKEFLIASFICAIIFAYIYKKS